MMAMQIISALLPAIVYRSASGGGDYSRFTTKLRSNYAKGKLLSGKGSRDVIEGGTSYRSIIIPRRRKNGNILNTLLFTYIRET